MCSVALGFLPSFVPMLESHNLLDVRSVFARTAVLRDFVDQHCDLEEINDGLVESLLSYSENASGNEFSLKHELNDRTIQITFEPASAVISYQGKIGERRISSPRRRRCVGIWLGEHYAVRWCKTIAKVEAGRRPASEDFSDEEHERDHHPLRGAGACPGRLTRQSGQPRQIHRHSVTYANSLRPDHDDNRARMAG